MGCLKGICKQTKFLIRHNMPIDLNVLNPVWADPLPSSNYTPAVKWQCGVLHNLIQFQRHFIWFYMPHKIKAFIGSHLLKQGIFSARSPQDISLWSQSLWLLRSIHHMYLMRCLNWEDFEIQREDRGQHVDWICCLRVWKRLPLCIAMGVPFNYPTQHLEYTFSTTAL